MTKPTILITNDDGIYAPGLRSLWKGLKNFYNVVIVAPAYEQSGVGLSVTLRSPLHIDPVEWEEETPAWKITGTPADCVRLATRVLLKNQPDLIVSGMNKGSNSGRTVLYSGTVGGVIDATMRGIPGIAFSCEDWANPQYHYFEDQVLPITQYLLDNPLPYGTFLNVSFPSNFKDSHKGCRLAKQGLGYFKENPLKGNHPEGRDYYWMGCDWHECDEHEESDVRLLQEGYITVVPIQVSQLTDHDAFLQRKTAFQEHFQR